MSTCASPGFPDKTGRATLQMLMRPGEVCHSSYLLECPISSDMLTTVQDQNGTFCKAGHSLVSLVHTTVKGVAMPQHHAVRRETGAKSRPQVHRLRSNSVPVAVSLMGCTEEEAGLIFSTAERASARRRKGRSVDESRLTPSSTSKRLPPLPTPVSEDAVEGDDQFEATTPSTVRGPKTPPPPRLEEDHSPPISPEIKSYNHDMAQFIRDRLQHIAHGHDQPSSPPGAQPQNQSAASPRRPPLVSRFSNWSTTTDAESVGPEIADFASSPPADSPMDDEKGIERGAAKVLHFKSRYDMGSDSPNYFSSAKRSPPQDADMSTNIETPSSADFRVASAWQPPRAVSSPPALIDLDAAALDRRQSRRSGFFDFAVADKRLSAIAASPESGGYHKARHMSPYLGSPQPIAC